MSEKIAFLSPSPSFTPPKREDFVFEHFPMEPWPKPRADAECCLPVAAAVLVSFRWRKWLIFHAFPTRRHSWPGTHARSPPPSQHRLLHPRGPAWCGSPATCDSVLPARARSSDSLWWGQWGTPARCGHRPQGIPLEKPCVRHVSGALSPSQALAATTSRLRAVHRVLFPAVQGSEVVLKRAQQREALGLLTLPLAACRTGDRRGSWDPTHRACWLLA